MINSKEILEKVSEITGTKYETDYYWGNPIVLMALEDMVIEYTKLKFEFENYQEDVKENYKKIEQKDQYDIYE